MIFYNIIIFSLSASKSHPPDPKLGLQKCPISPKKGWPDRRNRPKIGSRSAISKTGSPIQKFNSSLLEPKNQTTTSQKYQFSLCFFHVLRYTCEGRVQAIRSSNLTRLGPISELSSTNLGPIFGRTGPILGLSGPSVTLWTRSWPISRAVLGCLDIILDRSNGNFLRYPKKLKSAHSRAIIGREMPPPKLKL